MPSDGPIFSESLLSVEEFRDLTNRRLRMELLAGEEGLQKEINSPRIQKLGLALAGYTEYVQQGRVQFIGLSEITFLKTLDPKKRAEAVEEIFSREIKDKLYVYLWLKFCFNHRSKRGGECGCPRLFSSKKE